MKDIKRVMVCLDLSDYSIETIESALCVAKWSGTEFLLLNVIDTRYADSVVTAGSGLPDAVDVESYVKQVQTKRQQDIQKMLDKHFPSDREKMKILFRPGSPDAEILDAIEEENIDLVVIASKGKSNLIGTLHGSNAEKIFRHSPVPVLIVRNRERFNLNRSNRGR